MMFVAVPGGARQIPLPTGYAMLIIKLINRVWCVVRCVLRYQCQLYSEMHPSSTIA